MLRYTFEKPNFTFFYMHTYNPEWKTPLERHQDCVKAVYACKTAEDFDAIPTWIEEER